MPRQKRTSNKEPATSLKLNADDLELLAEALFYYRHKVNGIRIECEHAGLPEAAKPLDALVTRTRSMMRRVDKRLYAFKERIRKGRVVS